MHLECTLIITLRVRSPAFSPLQAQISAVSAQLAMSEPKTESEVISKFQDMRQAIRTTWEKLNDIETEAAEHDLVIKQLEPMDKSRKCFRMIGDVLVERTVAETLPAVQRNREGLGAVMQQLQTQLEAQQKALAAFQQKYKIRVGQPGVEQEEPDQAAAAAAARKPASGKPSSSSSKTSKEAGAGVLI